MMLQDRVAVIYGAGGAIGGAIARAFAAEGATLFLTGRRLGPVELVAEDIVAAGGSAEAAEVDALDEPAVDRHLQAVVDTAGQVDISVNAVGIPNAGILGVPLVELAAEQFALPITTYTASYFLTARSAGRLMIENRSGVIMTVTALHSRTGLPLVGGYGPAMAAKEALTRDLSAELAPRGIRVVGLRPQGMPESRDDPRCLPAAGGGHGAHLGPVAGDAGRTDPPATVDDPGRDGEHGGLPGLGQGERVDRHHRQPDPG